MITRALIFIKHRMPWVWAGIECLNSVLFVVLHRKRMQVQVDRAFGGFRLEGFDFRTLVDTDLAALETMIQSQGEQRLRYFQPHGFDRANLRRMHSSSAFLMFGVFKKDRIVGYFFLRCFWNRKCFVGRLIDEPFEGRGVGRVMSQIMYHAAWWSGFRCLTTISKHNSAVVRSHNRNPHARVVGELSNDYLLVEFTPSGDSGGVGL